MSKKICNFAFPLITMSVSEMEKAKYYEQSNDCVNIF